MITRTISTAKGKTVETLLTDERALEILGEIENPNTFALDLLVKARKYGLSHDQMVWVHVLVNEVEGKTQAPETVEGFQPIVAYLSAAVANGLKWPKIRLMTSDMRPVVLSLTGSRAKRPGTVNITDGGPYGNNTWYGRISSDGQLEPSHKLDEAVQEILRDFADDPVATARAQGSLTSNCCFCGKDLSTKESVGAGYGPVCANHWGLPWGEETAEVYEEKKEQALDAAEAAISVSESQTNDDFFSQF